VARFGHAGLGGGGGAEGDCGMRFDPDTFKGRATIILGGGAIAILINELFESLGQATLGFMFLCFFVSLAFVVYIYNEHRNQKWFKLYLIFYIFMIFIATFLVIYYKIGWTPTDNWGWRGAGMTAALLMAGVAELFKRGFGPSEPRD
jgi:hypothetical protein